jgi:V-type H+-transporting ATPase subunit H
MFWICDALGICVQLRSPSHPTRGIPTAVSSLATLLRIPKVRAMFIKSDGTKLLAPLITPASNQQYIQVMIVHIVFRLAFY